MAATVSTSRDLATIQPIVDTLPVARMYCTDPAAVYAEVIWPHDGSQRISVQKEQTQRIESLNADLRTYLGRLARLSRCFSRALYALADAVRLFVVAYNARQRLLNQYPTYKDVLPLRL